MKEIFKNYETFYNMVLSTTIMSNTITPGMERDGKKIIEFIGNAYKQEQAFIERSTKIILEELSSLGLTIDQQAVYGSRVLGDEYSDKDVLFDIKGDVLSKLQSVGENMGVEGNKNWFDYSHYKTYDPYVRFAKINVTAATGNLISTRQVGILKALGIGCDKDLNEAIARFKQCVFWGDIPAAYYAAYAYELLGDEKKAKLYFEVAELVKTYINTGCTVLPDEVKSRYSAEACVYYVYIASIKQDIVYAYEKKNIDFSFIEAIISDDIDYFDRMYHINNYERREWKNITNSSQKPIKRIGFN